MKIQPPLWIFSPFGQPSYWTTSSHSPFGSILNTRPKGMSTHHRFPSRSNEGPSRKLSTCAPPRLGSDQVVRRFLRNFAGSEVKGRAWMRLIFWKGLCIAAPREVRRITQVLGARQFCRATRNAGAAIPQSISTSSAGSIALFLHPFLDRVLDVLDLVDLDVDEAPADLVDAADIDRLHDVASLRVDRDRAARTFPLHALGGGYERLGVGLAAGLLQRFVDEVHSVPAADAEEIRVATPRRVVGGDEFRVCLGLVVVVVVKGGDEAERGIAHHLERILLGDFALAHDAGLLRIDAQIQERLAEGGRLRPAGNENEHRLGVEVLRALYEREKVGIRHRNAHRTDDLAAGLLERALERALGVVPGTVVRHHRI